MDNKLNFFDIFSSLGSVLTRRSSLILASLFLISFDSFASERALVSEILIQNHDEKRARPHVVFDLDETVCEGKKVLV